MPEMEKYLNRDGLDEYNSLLPHSSGEMQEYVNDWLDAHPEATTTVQDGAIAEPKLADKSVSLRTLADDTVHMLKGMMLTREISGNALSGDDAYSAPPVSLTVAGKSTQDGTPTPDAPVEIISIEQLRLMFAGKQLMDWAHPFRTGTYNYNVAVGTTIESGTNSNIEVSVEGNTLTMYVAVAWGGAIWRSPNLPNGTYHIMFPIASVDGGTGSSCGSTLFIVDRNNKVVRKINAHATTGDWSTVIVLTGEEAAICVNAGTRSGTYGNTFVYDSPQLVSGSVVSDYAPFSLESVLLNLTHALRSLPDGTHDALSLTYLRPSTREGWAWYSRELVQKLTALDMGNLSITKSGNFYRVTQANMKLATENGQWILMCECLRYNNAVTKGWFEANEVNNTIRPIYGQSFKAYIRADAYATVTDLKAALAGNEVVYKLATPITTTLDPIELPVLPAPNCTVWSDPSTGLQMRYMRDSNLVIQRIEEAIADQ